MIGPKYPIDPYDLAELFTDACNTIKGLDGNRVLRERERLLRSVTTLCNNLIGLTNFVQALIKKYDELSGAECQLGRRKSLQIACGKVNGKP